MQLPSNPIELLLHVDRYLDQVVSQYGGTAYLVLMAIVFCETGLVVMPFLPGDSLLFAAGALAGRGTLRIEALAPALLLATFLGDNVNYFVGKFLGPRIMRNETSRVLNRKHLERTHAFFEKYGGKTIVLARFVPIVRTFTPFVAGVGAMSYGRFVLYSVGAACLWVGICTFGGFFFGRLAVVQKNFSLVVLAIVGISLLPAVVEFLRHRQRAKKDV